MKEVGPRQEYIQKCKEENKKLMDNGPVLIKYIRDKNRSPVGVVVGFDVIENGKERLAIGYSKVNSSLERFNKHIGINKAISRADLPEHVIADVQERFGSEETRKKVLEDVFWMIGEGIEYFGVA